MIRIDIIDAHFPGCYFVLVDDDPEHPMSTGCTSLIEARDYAIGILERLIP